MSRANQTVTFLGDLKDCYLDEPVDHPDKHTVMLRLNCGSPGITTFSSMRIELNKGILLASLIEEHFGGYDREIAPEIDLGWVRYLKILEIDDSDQALIQFDLGGMSNTFLGVTALKIKVDRHSLAALVPNYETKLMRERYQALGVFRKWLWRRLFGKAMLIGLPGVKLQ